MSFKSATEWVGFPPSTGVQRVQRVQKRCATGQPDRERRECGYSLQLAKD